MKIFFVTIFPKKNETHADTGWSGVAGYAMPLVKSISSNLSTDDELSVICDLKDEPVYNF